MSQVQLHLVSLAIVFALGCNGCDSDNDAYVPGTEAQAELSAADALSARLQARQLDRSKTYTKDSDGRVACGSDKNCFVMQAEHCTLATLTTDEKFNPYGIEQRVQALYLILGSEGGKCKLVREVVSLDVTLHPSLLEALRKKSDGEELIASMKSESLETMQRDNPAREECLFEPEQALAAAIDIADGKYRSGNYAAECYAGAFPNDHAAAVEKPPTPTAIPAPPPVTTDSKPTTH